VRRRALHRLHRRGLAAVTVVALSLVAPPASALTAASGGARRRATHPQNACVPTAARCQNRLKCSCPQATNRPQKKRRPLGRRSSKVLGKDKLIRAGLLI